MSDGFSLLLVLVIVYLSDCAIFLHRQAVALVRPWRKWHARRAGWELGNAKGALLGLQPLPPLGLLHETAGWPVSLSEDGICAFSGASFAGVERPPQSGTSIRYDGIRETSAVGRELRVNGTAFATALTAPMAQNLAELVRSLTTTPRDARKPLIVRAIDASLDHEAAAKASASIEDQTRALRRICIALWCHLYLVCPAVTMTFGLNWLIIPLAVAGLSIQIPTLVRFFRLHRRIHPGEGVDRLEQVFRMSLCPPMAIRAVDAVTRHGIPLHHPAAATVGLCSKDESSELLSLLVRDLRYPSPVPLEGDAAKIESFFRGVLLDRLLALADRQGIAIRSEPDPAHTDADSKTFCPRCLNVFTLAEGVCHDCFDLKLLPLPHRPDSRKDKK